MNWLKKALLGAFCYVAVFLTIILSATCEGCMPAKSTEAPIRAQLRAAVLSVATATIAVDQVCAQVAREVYTRGDKNGATSLARACDASYDVAREALVAAEEALDKKDDRSASCGLSHGLAALESSCRVLEKAGVKIPDSVSEVRAVATAASALVSCT